LHLVGSLSSPYVHDARSQEPKTGWAYLNALFQMRWNLACRINGNKKMKANGEQVGKKKQAVANRLF